MATDYYIIIGSSGMYPEDYEEWILGVEESKERAESAVRDLNVIASVLESQRSESNRFNVPEQLLEVDPRAQMDRGGTKYRMEAIPAEMAIQLHSRLADYRIADYRKRERERKEEADGD